MGDVADGIVDLALVERTTAPVGKARAFIELKADPRLDEVRIADLFGLTQRHLAALRVEDRVRRLAGQVEDDFEILPARLKAFQHILIADEQVEQRLKVDARRPRIDRHGLVARGHRDTATVWPT